MAHHVISLRCGIWPLSGQYRTLATERPEDYGFTAFCNGPDEVKSPSDCHAAELTLLSVVSAEAATRCY